jgi:RimJ/RimL family protein N-acetyltransferase
VKQLAQQALTSIKADLQARRFEQARTRLVEVATWTRQNKSLLSAQQQAWVARHQWGLAPLWSEPVQHGVVSLRRCGADDAAFFRAVFQDTAFTNRFNRQRPWSGDLGRALHKFGHEPPALLKMLQWVVCLRSEPVGLISLSHLDLTNARAEFSIGFPQSMSAGISHKACLLAMHFAFCKAGLNKLYGYVYEGNDHALQSALRIGLKREGFLIDHFRFPPNEFVGVHLLGLTRRQALQNPGLVKAMARRTGHHWSSDDFATGVFRQEHQLARSPQLLSTKVAVALRTRNRPC